MKGISRTSKFCQKKIRYLSSLTHIDSSTNQPIMVDVSSKNISQRIAIAQAIVDLPSSVYQMIRNPSPNFLSEIQSKKGPVFSTAIIAGTMAAKKTSDLIPFCHNIMLEKCTVEIQLIPQTEIQMVDSSGSLLIHCTCKTSSKTGVEMEALVGASTAALTIYDMLKALSHDIVVRDVRLLHKSGGKSGIWNHPETIK